MKNHIVGLGLLLLLAVVIPANAVGQQINQGLRAVESLQRLDTNLPLQKLFIQTDKDDYISGENIWLKAYLLKASSHIPVDLNSTLVIELFNSNGQAVASELFRLDNGLAWGHISLHDSMPDGNYKIRAYTEWLRNFGEEHFFQKEVYIHNPLEANYINSRELRRNQQFNRSLEQKQAQRQFAVFPEGGHLLAGLENRVAFKAADGMGGGVNASGSLVDRTGREVASFAVGHDGMGKFRFVPEAGMTYTAQIVFDNGSRRNFPFPEANTSGYMLRVDNTYEGLNIALHSRFSDGDPYAGAPAYVVVHTRGRPLFVEEAVWQNGIFRTSVPFRNLVSGVTRVTVFDASGNAVAERLVFVNRNDLHIPRVSLENIRINGTEGIQADMQFDFKEIGEDWGHYSLRLLGSDVPLEDSKHNMASYLLLSSDLVADVRDPWSYFVHDTDEWAGKLDLLMLTHGWRKYDWNALLAGSLPAIKYEDAPGLTLSGRVVPTSSRMPAGMLNVELTIRQDKARVLAAKTDAQGNFSFKGIQAEGPFVAELLAERETFSRSLRIVLDERQVMDIDYQQGLFTRPNLITSRSPQWVRSPQPRTTLHSLAPTPVRGEETTSIYGQPDQVIYMEDVRGKHNNIASVLRGRVTGLVDGPGGTLMIRGPSSINISSEPLYLIDGTIVGSGMFLQMNPEEVERIEVVTGPKAAIFGARGGSGVIAMYTRKNIPGVQKGYEFLINGYAVPVSFYLSNIESSRFANSKVPRTLFWEPVIFPDEQGNISVSVPLVEQWKHKRFFLEGIDNNGRITVKEINVQ